MKKRVLVGIVAGLCITSLFGCNNTGSTNEGDIVKIAIAAPMTGDNAEYGISFTNAAQIKVDEWNEKGGVLGKKIEVVTYDDKNNGDEAASIAQKIVSDKDIVGVIGHFASGVSMVAAPTYNENKILEVSNCASHPDYAKIGEYIFRNNTVISSEVDSVLDMIVNDLGLSKIGMISIKTDWGVSTSAIAQEKFEELKDLGIELVAHEEVVEGSDDYSTNINKLKNAGAEAVLVVGMYSTIAPFAKQYKAIDPDIKILGFSNAFSEQLISLGGEAVEGILFPVSFYYGSDDELSKKFVNAYIENYKSVPSSLAAQAYESAEMILMAIEEAGTTTDKEAIREAIANIKYEGVTGTTTFDEEGNAMKSYKKVTVKEGKFILVE